MSKKKQIKASSMNANKNGVVVGYMDLIDFECELGAASGGNKVYPSIEDALKNHGCAEECGIVKVEIRAIEIVLDPKE